MKMKFMAEPCSRMVELAGKYVGPHAMTLVLEDPTDDFSLFAYAWLASPTGVQAIRATSYGTKILGVRKDLLRALPVPVAPNSIVRRVAKLVRRCTSGREEYATEIREAQILLEQTPEMRDAFEACSTRSSRSIVWDGPLPSIRAWNFAAGGGVVRLLGQRWKAQLRDVLVANGIFNGPRFARVECSPPYGIDFLSQRDVFMIRPVGRRIVLPAIPKRLLFVPRNALLVGSHGQMNEGSIFGKVELASFAGWRSGITQDILRVLAQDCYRELAYAFLSTTVGQWLLKSTAVGTSIPSMRLDLLERLPFPDPSLVTLDKIRQHVLKAEEARIAADEAEAAAIRIIEEEVLPQWLA
ncbi:restriction endonuclease subunit S [Bradyrhizobium sp. BR 1432]|uniref:restriction endonuclease subunit S n=1 Tax=Bradyrhizobium sp. BR 1432 TaxID=3447966 RepID=UPI003EE4EBBD